MLYQALFFRVFERNSNDDHAGDAGIHSSDADMLRWQLQRLLRVRKKQRLGGFGAGRLPPNPCPLHLLCDRCPLHLLCDVQYPEVSLGLKLHVACGSQAHTRRHAARV